MITDVARCPWAEKDDLYRKYHDKEWGKPLYDDIQLFEYLVLESFQAGLSWHTILKKREAFREAFDQFDLNCVAQFDNQKIEQLLQNENIVRHRAKILAAIINAKQFILIRKEYGSFADYIWSFVNNTPIDNQPKTLQQIPSKTELSDIIAKNLKQRGFQFLGSTTIYSFMQAIGMVNDHLVSCCARKK